MALAIFARYRTTHVRRPTRIAKLTDDGRFKFNLKTDGNELYFNEIEGNREVLATVSVAGGPIRRIYSPFSNVELQDISNDGQYLLGLVQTGTERERPLWHIPTQGGTPTRIGDITCSLARKSYSKNLIACATGASVGVWDPESNGFHTVGSFASGVTDLEWSRDSDALRLTLQDSMSGDFSTWDLTIPRNKGARAVPRRAILGNNCCSSWTWLNEYRDFAFLKHENDAKPRLFIRSEKLSLGSSEYELPIEIGTLDALVPASTPNKLYVLMEGSTRSQLLKFDDTQHVFQTFLPGFSARYVSFSRDGKWMTYVDDNQKLWRSRVDGSDAMQLSRGMEYVQLSSWSPDGHKIAFMGASPGRQWRIYIVDRDGGEPREAAKGEDGQGAPTWSPDGSQIAYGNVLCGDTQTCWIRMIDLRTGHEDKLPGSHDLRTARWAPNGRYIAALSPDTHQLMLFDVAKRRWRILAENVTGDTLNWSVDSKSIYADSPQGARPVIERIRVGDRRRTVVVGLSELEKISGRMEFWFGLAPDGSPILVHLLTASEIYSVEWNGS
jgi:Tol biopolymer transport system component